MTSATGYCSLEAVLGWAKPCSGPACVFWNANAGACVFHDVEHELEGRSALARHLLDLRHALEQGTEVDRARFFHLLNEEQGSEASEH